MRDKRVIKPKKRQALAIFLALMMMVTIIPTQAFADVTTLPIYMPEVVEDKLDTQITTSANFVIGEPVIYSGKGYEAILCITDQSKDTFAGEIKLKNTSDWEIENWHIECDLQHEIVDMQNAKYERQDDSICMIQGIEEYAFIPIGESITMPFKATYSEVIELPSYFMLYEDIDYENPPEDEEEYKIWKENIFKRQEGRKATRKSQSRNRAIQFAAEEPKTGSISNEYVKFNYLNGNYGLFTTGGNPDDPNDDNKKLLYGDGGTSYTTIRIDGTNHIFSPDTVTRYENKIIGTKRYGDIIVSQHIGIISNQYTKRDDVVEFFYTVENTSDTPHEVGVRIMFDTMLGDNDAAPFRLPTIGDVTTETDLSGADIPEFWQAFDSLSKPSVIAQGTLNIDKSSTPDRVRFTSWESATVNPWDYAREAGRSNGDSAVCLYWNEQELSEGDVLSCKTFYGLSALQQDLRPPLAVALTGATRLEVVKNKEGKEEYSPNPFTVTAYIQNIGTGTATNARITLNLPSGMEIVEGEKTVDLGDIPVGTKQYQVSWKVKVAPSPVDKTEKYGVTVVADNADEKTLEREIFIPKLKTSNIKLLLDRNSLVNGNTLYLKFKIINEGNEIIDLSKLCTRYYYIDESTNISKQINCDWAQFDNPYGTLKSNITMKSVQNIKPLRKDANAYVEFGFNSSTKQLAPGQEATISARVNNSSWANMIVTNDYSYIGNNNAVQNGYVLWEYMPVYDISDMKNPIFGIEPPIGDNLESNLLVEVKPTVAAGSNSMNLNIKVTNKGISTIDLSDLNLKYYYSNDSDLAQSVNSNWIGGRINNNYVSITNKSKVKVVEMDDVREKADTYVDIAFNKNAGVLAYNDYVEMQLTVYNTSWKSGKYNTSNDYSYGVMEGSINPNEWIETDRIIAIDHKNEIVKGIEPRPISYEIMMNPQGIIFNRGMNIKLKVLNTGEGDIDLQDFMLEYYYTNDNSLDTVFREQLISMKAQIDRQQKILNKGDMSVKVEPMDSSYTYEFADTCIQVTFSEHAGVIHAGESVLIDIVVANANLLEGYNINNDHSYIPMLIEQLSNQNRASRMAASKDDSWEYRVNKGVLGNIFYKTGYTYMNGSFRYVLCKKEADFGKDTGYSKLNDLMEKEGFEYKLGPEGYEFLLIYELPHLDRDKKWAATSVVGMCPGCSVCTSSQNNGLQGIYCKYKLQYIKAVIVEYGNTGQTDGQLTLGFGTAIPLEDGADDFSEIVNAKVAPYAPKLAVLLLSHRSSLLRRKSISADEAERYKATLNESIDMANHELITHIRSLNNEIKSGVFAGLKFEQHEFDSMVTLRYKQGNLRKYVEAIKEYKQWGKKPTVEDWIIEFKQDDNRYRDQFEMFLEGDYERDEW